MRQQNAKRRVARSSPVTIVIPQFQRHDVTLACLRSLRRHDPHPWPVLVVDDGSPDRQQLVDIERQPHVTILHQPHRGVTAAWNAGWRTARTPWTIFLNNDVMSRGAWVERLLAPLINAEALMTGVRLRREKCLPRTIERILPTCDVLEGWCFAVGRHSLRLLHGFDPQLTTYWSDTDLQLRLIEYGRSHSPLRALPELPLEHIGHVTAHDPECLPQRRDIWQGDRMRFIAKWKAHHDGTKR